MPGGGGMGLPVEEIGGRAPGGGGMGLPVAAVGGRGDGRVEPRQDKETGEIVALEVNAQCGISEDEAYTSIGAILKFARIPFSGAVHEIIKVSAATAAARPRLTRTRRAVPA